MKQILISGLIIIFIFFLIGLFFSSSKISSEKKTVPWQQNQRPIRSPSELNPLLKISSELEEKINQDVSQLTKNLMPEEDKNLETYRQEIVKLQQKFNPEKIENLSPEFFFNLARELSLIRPPTLFYNFHLELIKIYYSVGLALQEIQKTNDPLKKIMLYNFIETNIKKLNLK